MARMDLGGHTEGDLPVAIPSVDCGRTTDVDLQLILEKVEDLFAISHATAYRLATWQAEWARQDPGIRGS